MTNHPHRSTNPAVEYRTQMHGAPYGDGLYQQGEDTMTDWTEVLPKNACQEAVEWARTQPDLATAWAGCERGDWMLWLAGRWSGPLESASRKKLVLAACTCARLALPYAPEGEKRPLRAIETAELWARSAPGVTPDDVRVAAVDADAAIYAAADAAIYAAAAAYAAIYAAADAAIYAAATAATATAYAAYAADDADDAVARRATLAQCADIVRQFYPEPPARTHA